MWEEREEERTRGGGGGGRARVRRGEERAWSTLLECLWFHAGETLTVLLLLTIHIFPVLMDFFCASKDVHG